MGTINRHWLNLFKRSAQGSFCNSYLHDNAIPEDHLTGTAVVSDSSGALVSSIKYYPFGECRNSQGNPGTDKLFTGQRLDGTGLYYYGARYYDPTVGRFISPDPFVQWSTGLNLVTMPLTVNVVCLGLKDSPLSTPLAPLNPQALNRYSYCLNNPLKYTDPTGYWNWGWIVAGVVLVVATVATGGLLAAVALPAIAAEVATATTGWAIYGALHTAAVIGMTEGCLAIGTFMGAGMIYKGATMEPGSQALVTFGDGSSGYFTLEEIYAIMDIGTTMVGIGITMVGIEW